MLFTFLPRIYPKTLLKGNFYPPQRSCGQGYFYPPQRSCGQGYVFTCVCDYVHRGVCLSACWDTATPPRRRHPLPRRPPQEGGTPLPRRPPRRTPPKKEAPQEGGGSDPGPHPKRKLRRIRSRPTPKVEIEGDQIQVPPPAYGQ